MGAIELEAGSFWCCIITPAWVGVQIEANGSAPRWRSPAMACAYSMLSWTCNRPNSRPRSPSPRLGGFNAGYLRLLVERRNVKEGVGVTRNQGFFIKRNHLHPSWVVEEGWPVGYNVRKATVQIRSLLGASSIGVMRIDGGAVPISNEENQPEGRGRATVKADVSGGLQDKRGEGGTKSK
ncbi:hypothetical protein OIDMADRAFT_30762 [Oidiodendron maius Zn]|uniref:Uncharacterized protein n=1 Tax=Oidiodendron maius (strain Zn) TaxID=913774 RepID=A0A0C3DB30_OIDMZ|nr:hypothetical protein OIDMADRAFT_30762 [Oidiodendron maius Zn]